MSKINMQIPVFVFNNKNFENNISSNKTFSEIWKESSTEKKVGLAVSLVFLSVPVGSYYLIRDGWPLLSNWMINNIVLPIGKVVDNIMQKVFIDLPKKVYETVIKPISLVIKNTVIWTHENALTSTLKAIKKAVHAVFTTFQKLVCQHVLEPFKERIKNIADWTHTHILTPIGRVIENISKKIIEKVKQMIDPVCVKIGQTVKQVGVWTNEKILTPIKKAAQAIFTTTPKWVYQNVLTPLAKGLDKIANWTYDNVLSPLSQTIKNAVDDIFKKCLKFNQQVVVPISKEIKKTAILVYDHALTPLIQLTFKAAKHIHNDAVIPVRKWTHAHVIVPISNTVNELMTEAIPAAFKQIKSKFA